MNVQGKPYRTIWLDPSNDQLVKLIDQRSLPHQFIIAHINSVQMMAKAINEMWVRGAGLIGASAAYGMYLASLKAIQKEDPLQHLQESANMLLHTRPTAVNLSIAISRMMTHLKLHPEQLVAEAKRMAQIIADEDAESCRMIGENGLAIIEQISKNKDGETVNILTHCNAGWLAFVDYGSALSPIYLAHEKGIKIHVCVDETRPRNQGTKLTAWELKEQGVPHTIIADNTGGHLMQHQMVDLVLVGSDRCTRTGDLANKIGTYLKALAAYDNQIPFYVALPSSTIDWSIQDGIKEIPIEQRDAREVKYMEGLHENGKIEKILISPQDSPAINYGFDVTPARLITGIICERGISDASENGLLKLFPEEK
ncbi:MAG: S-methyl-5-thioribose-1-phosphate isomerase [Bacteroidales bacterium]|nr:S-methyl-5-thioribose-1-phosphate isomerase [Bacteroidales bacterium]